MRAALVIALIALAGATARGQPLEGTALAEWERGLERYQARDYQAAIAAFSASYQAQPRRAALFAWAQAERLSGDCPSAIVLYRRYLEAEPSARQAEAARDQIRRCVEALASRPSGGNQPASETQLEPATEPEPGAEAGPPAPATGPSTTGPPSPTAAHAPELAVRTAPAPSAAWYRDLAGGLLVGSGAIALGAGGWLLWTSSRDADAASYQQHADQQEDVGRERVLSLVLLGGGAALVTAGVLRYALRDRGGDGPTANAWLSSDQVGVALTSEF